MTLNNNSPGRQDLAIRLNSSSCSPVNQNMLKSQA